MARAEEEKYSLLEILLTYYNEMKKEHVSHMHA